MRRQILFAALVLLPLSIAGVASAHEPADAPEPPKPAGSTAAGPATANGPNGNAVPDADGYRIGPEDVLKISVWNTEALSPTVQVRPDGKISLPLLNDVQAAGLTPDELRDFLAKALVKYMPNPEVSVVVTEVKSYKISVIGEVARPGRYELKSLHTVLDVLALAGGLTQFAARSKIVVLRPDGNTVKRIPFNYTKVFPAGSALLERITNFGGGEQENFYLRSGDIVLVP